MRRAEIGIHHYVAGAYLLRYAPESSWREDNPRASNGDQANHRGSRNEARKERGFYGILAPPHCQVVGISKNLLDTELIWTRYYLVISLRLGCSIPKS
ncbi:hypothetical protein [Bradyrhizobium brasilense]|uniref:hypothetical protein n=1 Tax=Bradyrhizobium brasilense TaxID=1419277 RepID=UPI003D315BA3